MTATYASYSASAWQDPSISVDPFANPYHQTALSSSAPSTSSLVHKKQLPPEIQSMKNRRRRRTVASGVVGTVIGFVALGPVGGIAAGAGSAYAAKKIGKRNEKRRMEQLEAQQNPLRSNGSGEML